MLLGQARGELISIHALRVEGDPGLGDIINAFMNFYPRPPGGGRHHIGRIRCAVYYFYPRPPGGGRRRRILTTFFRKGISIHALRVEGDFLSCFYPPRFPTISIHALRVEGDSDDRAPHQACGYFYPRPPGGGRPGNRWFNELKYGISIHALRVEGDRERRCDLERRARFLSTPSGWRATFFKIFLKNLDLISIHALRVEGDAKIYYLLQNTIYFYPRPPGGGRRRLCDLQFLIFQFLSTPSGWRATSFGISASKSIVISIHALRVEGDPRNTHRLPNVNISIHALRVEGDGLAMGELTQPKAFLSTPSGWRAT